METKHHHSPGFLALVQDAKRRIREITIAELLRAQEAGEPVILVDTREDREWDQSRIGGAQHLSKGTIERDIERTIPDKAAPIVCYCGGGFRSALVCDNLQKMGYTNVRSLAGGFRSWQAEGRPVES
jgi:rhodanese-related sulfurtransferase